MEVVVNVAMGEAHPRSRGENGPPMTLAIVEWGSSPLTRGKQVAVSGARRIRGLIPAHPGKTY